MESEWEDRPTALGHLSFMVWFITGVKCGSAFCSCVRVCVVPYLNMMYALYCLYCIVCLFLVLCSYKWFHLTYRSVRSQCSASACRVELSVLFQHELLGIVSSRSTHGGHCGHQQYNGTSARKTACLYNERRSRDLREIISKRS